jgi:hypothetical protein
VARSLRSLQDVGMVRPQVTGRAGRQVEDSFQRIKVIPQSQEEMLNYIK